MRRTDRDVVIQAVKPIARFRFGVVTGRADHRQRGFL